MTVKATSVIQDTNDDLTPKPKVNAESVIRVRPAFKIVNSEDQTRLSQDAS
jgi:hypothetical protein